MREKEKKRERERLKKFTAINADSIFTERDAVVFQRQSKFGTDDKLPPPPLARIGGITEMKARYKLVESVNKLKRHSARGNERRKTRARERTR